jgi:hypothetical protein
LQQKAGQQLAALSGRAFNVSFSDMQVSGHTIAIKQTKREARLGSNPAVKAAARSSIGMLEMHLRLAEAALKSSHVLYPPK